LYVISNLSEPGKNLLYPSFAYKRVVLHEIRFAVTLKSVYTLTLTMLVFDTTIKNVITKNFKTLSCVSKLTCKLNCLSIKLSKLCTFTLGFLCTHYTCNKINNNK